MYDFARLVTYSICMEYFCLMSISITKTLHINPINIKYSRESRFGLRWNLDLNYGPQWIVVSAVTHSKLAMQAKISQFYEHYEKNTSPRFQCIVKCKNVPLDVGAITIHKFIKL